MKISKKVKIALRSLLMKCGAIATDKATLLFEGAEIEVGTEVFVEDENGEILPAPDGEYKVGNTIYVVKDGKVDEIRNEEAENEAGADAEAEGDGEGEGGGEGDGEGDGGEGVEGEEEEPQAEPIDAPEQTEEETVEDRMNRLEASIGEIREGIESMLEAVAALTGRLEAVEEKLKGLEEPAADPAEDTEETQETNSRLSYLKKKK